MCTNGFYPDHAVYLIVNNLPCLGLHIDCILLHPCIYNHELHFILLSILYLTILVGLKFE